MVPKLLRQQNWSLAGGIRFFVHINNYHRTCCIYTCMREHRILALCATIHLTLGIFTLPIARYVIIDKLKDCKIYRQHLKHVLLQFQKLKISGSQLTQLGHEAQFKMLAYYPRPFATPMPQRVRSPHSISETSIYNTHTTESPRSGIRIALESLRLWAILEPPLPTTTQYHAAHQQ